jgi:hypothetical protein
MRSLLLLVMVTGCFAAGGGGSGGTRTGVLPMLSELPSDPGKRDAILDQANQTPGPEARKSMKPKERRAESTAATAAALLGQMFSDHQNVTIGAATSFDEVPNKAAPPPSPFREEGSQPGGARPPVDAAHMVPWIKLDQKPQPKAQPKPEPQPKPQPQPQP